ncbi:LacI family transcriptional regulator [Microbacterium sp. Se63.02b]|nr:LacI family transcriptional regulator [Microbacterium sp. Se63.02b]
MPDDIAIVGYNNIDQTQLSPIPVTTISTPRYDMGTLAASLLLAEFDADHRHSHTVMDTHLVVRESTTASPTR